MLEDNVMPLPGVTLQQLQDLVRIEHKLQGWDTSATTLMLGVVEEVGELAKALLVYHCDDYVLREGCDAEDYDGVAHEVGDIIVYLMGLCNALDIQPEYHLKALNERYT